MVYLNKIFVYRIYTDAGFNGLFQQNICIQDERIHAGFINDAKEWAGELLSGQTKVNKL